MFSGGELKPTLCLECLHSVCLSMQQTQQHFADKTKTNGYLLWMINIKTKSSLVYIYTYFTNFNSIFNHIHSLVLNNLIWFTSFVNIQIGRWYFHLLWWTPLQMKLSLISLVGCVTLAVTGVQDKQKLPMTVWPAIICHLIFISGTVFISALQPVIASPRSYWWGTHCSSSLHS